MNTLRSQITIRPGYADDHLALVRLAALDSAAVPAGPLLVAELDGELSAALSLSRRHLHRRSLPPHRRHRRAPASARRCGYAGSSKAAAGTSAASGSRSRLLPTGPCSSGSIGTPGRRPRVDDVAAPELQLVGLGPRELRPGL